MIYAVRDYAHARRLLKDIKRLNPDKLYCVIPHYVTEPREILGLRFDTLVYPLFVHYDLLEDVRKQIIITGSKQEVQFI